MTSHVSWEVEGDYHHPQLIFVNIFDFSSSQSHMEWGREDEQLIWRTWEETGEGLVPQQIPWMTQISHTKSHLCQLRLYPLINSRTGNTDFFCFFPIVGLHLFLSCYWLLLLRAMHVPNPSHQETPAHSFRCISSSDNHESYHLPQSS